MPVSDQPAVKYKFIEDLGEIWKNLPCYTYIKNGDDTYTVVFFTQNKDTDWTIPISMVKWGQDYPPKYKKLDTELRQETFRDMGDFAMFNYGTYLAEHLIELYERNTNDKQDD
jgi:hypothetical protein